MSFEAVLVYINSFRTSRATGKDPVLKRRRRKKANKQISKQASTYAGRGPRFGFHHTHQIAHDCL